MKPDNFHSSIDRLLNITEAGNASFQPATPQYPVEILVGVNTSGEFEYIARWRDKSQYTIASFATLLHSLTNGSVKHPIVDSLANHVRNNPEDSEFLTSVFTVWSVINAQEKLISERPIIRPRDALNLRKSAIHEAVS